MKMKEPSISGNGNGQGRGGQKGGDEFRKVRLAAEHGNDEATLRAIDEITGGPSQLSGVSPRLKEVKRIGWSAAGIGRAAIWGALLGPLFGGGIGGGVMCHECQTKEYVTTWGCGCNERHEYKEMDGPFSRAIGVSGARDMGIVGAWFAGVLAGAAGGAAAGSLIWGLAGLGIVTEQKPVVSARDIVRGADGARKKLIWMPDAERRIIATVYDAPGNRLMVYLDDFTAISLDDLALVEKERGGVEPFQINQPEGKPHLFNAGQANRTFVGNKGSLIAFRDEKIEWDMKLADSGEIPIWEMREWATDAMAHPADPIPGTGIFYSRRLDQLFILQQDDPSLRIIDSSGKELARYERPEHIGTVPCHPVLLADGVALPFEDGYLAILGHDGESREFDMGPEWTNIWLAGYDNTASIFLASPAAVVVFH